MCHLASEIGFDQITEKEGPRAKFKRGFLPPRSSRQHSVGQTLQQLGYTIPIHKRLSIKVSVAD